MARYTLTLEGPNGKSLTRGIPSVTEIIGRVVAKPGLEDWYYKQGVLGLSNLMEKYGQSLPTDVSSLHSLLSQEGLSPYARRDEAGSKGNRIHEAVHLLASEPNKRNIAKVREEYPALEEWWDARGLYTKGAVVVTEQMVLSLKHGYAGTVDLIYRDPKDGQLWLADVKSGRVHSTHSLQLEMYRIAWEEGGGAKVHHMSVINVPRDGGEVRELEVPIVEQLTSAVRGLLAIYGWSTWAVGTRRAVP